MTPTLLPKKELAAVLQVRRAAGWAFSGRGAELGGLPRGPD